VIVVVAELVAVDDAEPVPVLETVVVADVDCEVVTVDEAELVAVLLAVLVPVDVPLVVWVEVGV